MHCGLHDRCQLCTLPRFCGILSSLLRSVSISYCMRATQVLVDPIRRTISGFFAHSSSSLYIYLPKKALNNFFNCRCMLQVMHQTDYLPYWAGKEKHKNVYRHCCDLQHHSMIAVAVTLLHGATVFLPHQLLRKDACAQSDLNLISPGSAVSPSSLR